MAFGNVLDPLLGSKLVSAKELHTPDGACVGILFELEDGGFYVGAEPDDDSIVVHVTTNGVSSIHRTHDTDIGLRDAPVSSNYVGEVFANYWFCESKPGYVDGMDLGFGDLNFPNVKLLCSLSEVLEFLVLRRREADV